MVSSFFKTFSFAVLTPAISTFPCMRCAPSNPETSYVQYGRRAFFLYWELLSLSAHLCETVLGQSVCRIGSGQGVSAVQCRIRDFRCKEVINVCDGCRLGYVSDLEVIVPEGKVSAIIVYGPCRFFGLFGSREEFYIPWECIQRIGDDIILIDKPFQRRDPRLERKRRQRR